MSTSSAASAEADLDRIAVVDGVSGAETTYRTLLGQIDAVAGAVAARGLGVGGVAAVLCPNVPAFAAVFHGLLRAGATVTTVNSLYTADEITSAARRRRSPSGMFTVSALLPAAREAAARAGIPAERLVVLDGAEGHPSLRDLLGAGAPAPVVSFDPATHVAVLPYSSGTTGRPKGVMLSHRNLVANAEQSRGLLNVSAEDRLLALLPFFHIYGLTVLLNLALRQRARLVTMPKFELAEFLRMIQDHQCSYPLHCPAGRRRAVEAPAGRRLRSQLRAHHPVRRRPARRGTRRQARQAPGLPGAAGLRHDRDEPGLAPDSGRRHGLPVSSVGYTVPNMDCRLVDPATGEDIDVPAEGTSAPGHLLCRGPNIMLGYLNRSEETADTLDSDGFLRTGDIATVGRRRRRDDCGPAQGAHQVQGLPDCPRGAGGAAAHPPRHRRRRRDRIGRRRRPGGARWPSWSASPGTPATDWMRPP